VNFIIVPLHSRDNAASKKLHSLYHLLDRFEVETVYKVELNDVWKFYSDFVNPAFQSIWFDDDY